MRLPPAIATRPPAIYSIAMPIAHFLRFLVLLALLLAPVSMASTHAAMALPAPQSAMTDHHMAPAAGHCADMATARDEAPADDSAPLENIDCAIACSCMPSTVGVVGERPSFTARVHHTEPSPLLTGLSPQAEPRPPKLA